MTNFESEIASIAEESPEKSRMIEQYRAVAGKFNELWNEIYPRTETGDWREDGVGSCHSSPGEFVTYIDGYIDDEIENLWIALDADNPALATNGNGENTDIPKTCRFHRLGRGCILADLKTPRCFTHTDRWQYPEIIERFGIDFPDFYTPLAKIQQGGVDLTCGDCSLHPERNDELVERTVEETEKLIEHIKSFPILASGVTV